MTSPVARSIGAALVVCAALTACGASTSSVGGHTTTPAAAGTSEATGAEERATTPTGSPGSEVSASSSHSRTPGTKPCGNGDVSVAVGRSAVATGHVGVTLVFHNVSGAECSLYGYPGVAGLDHQGHQVVQARRSLSGYLGGSYALRPVALRADERASARVEGTDVPAGGPTACPSYPRLLVTAPGLTRSQVLDASLPGCSAIEVHPVVAGTTGRT